MNGDNNMATEAAEGERTNGVANDNEAAENVVATGAVEANDAEVDAESAEPNGAEEGADVEEQKDVELAASEEPPAPRIETNNVEPKKVTVVVGNTSDVLYLYLFFYPRAICLFGSKGTEFLFKVVNSSTFFILTHFL